MLLDESLICGTVSPKPSEVKQLRLRNGWSTRDVSLMLNVTENAVWYWENGERPMKCAFWELLRIKAAVQNKRRFQL